MEKSKNKKKVALFGSLLVIPSAFFMAFCIDSEFTLSYIDTVQRYLRKDFEEILVSKNSYNCREYSENPKDNDYYKKYINTPFWHSSNHWDLYWVDSLANDAMRGTGIRLFDEAILMLRSLNLVSINPFASIFEKLREISATSPGDELVFLCRDKLLEIGKSSQEDYFLDQDFYDEYVKNKIKDWNRYANELDVLMEEYRPYRIFNHLLNLIMFGLVVYSISYSWRNRVKKEKKINYDSWR